MLLKHYFIGKIAHSSYILAGKDSCAVIDPRRDVDQYIDEARALGVNITHILETHLHADFVSGHMDLAERTGAEIYAPRSGECKFEHVPLSEGDTIELEDMKLSVIETPGHTPEHICYIVVDTSRGDDPVGIFTGDTLFVGDVGRPDLFPDMADELAAKLYGSLHEKILTLPDFCEVYPAHGAGSLCGRAMGAKWRSTIGYERRYNKALQIEDKAEGTIWKKIISAKCCRVRTMLTRQQVIDSIKGRIKAYERKRDCIVTIGHPAIEMWNARIEELNHAIELLS